MEQTAHFFFAIQIPTEIKQLMKERMEQLQEQFPFSSWVHHKDLHITLAFLGAASPDQLAQAVQNVKEVLAEEQAFTLEINQLGFFGREDSPRIFWVDTVERTELFALRDKVFAACQTADFQLETRPFRPHLTLARKWKGEHSFQKAWLNVWGKVQPEPITFLAKTVVLYQTHLDQVPKYEAVTLIPLRTQKI